LRRARFADAEQLSMNHNRRHPRALLARLCRSVLLPGLVVLLVAGHATAADAPAGAATPPADFVGPPKPGPYAVALASLHDLVEARTEKRAAIKALREELEHPEEDADRAQLTAAISESEASIDDINRQIAALATGVGEQEFDLDANLKIDLKAEAEQLLQPFVIMLRSLTEQARQIESLRRELSVATNHRAVARRAIAQIDPLLAAADDERVKRELTRQRKTWQQRLDAVEDLVAATQRQLDTRQANQVSTVDSANQFARSFLRERGLNLLYGGGVFFLTLLSLRFVSRRLGAYRGARHARKNLATRVITLVWAVGSYLVALLAMLFTFNILNDWLLVGVTVVFIVALAWIGVRMLPSLIEQITLYLNLGAVQEGERMFFDGIPWLVRKLGFYCDLVNPALEGGEFSMPIRELIGLHSRPVTPNEPWFPTRKGDFVRLETGLAEVLVQTPGLVEVRIEGGIRQTFTAAAFYEMAPQNLSHGSRAEVVFGISYKHQAIATNEVRAKLRAFVREGLGEVLRDDQIIRVDVELMRAGESSIDYGVEVDMTPDAAVHYDTAEWLLTRLCVDACNHYGWEIPFPQLVVHRGAETAAS
jgi:hypothetical protein